jgi:hypothetical protein
VVKAAIAVRVADRESPGAAAAADRRHLSLVIRLTTLVAPPTSCEAEHLAQVREIAVLVFAVHPLLIGGR